MAVRIAFSKVAISLFTPWLSLINASAVGSIVATGLSADRPFDNRPYIRDAIPRPNPQP